MQRRIFISYRRSDVGEDYAVRLADVLRQRVPDVVVFVDVRGIGLGPYSPQLENELASSHVVLALIGPRWIGATENRLEDPGDWVRRELEMALRGDKIVVPVLVDTALPPDQVLPLSVRPLRMFQAMRVDSRTFSEDASKLGDAISAIELAPTLRRREAEESAYRDLTALVARLQQLVLAQGLDLQRLSAAAEQYDREGFAHGEMPMDAGREAVLAAALSLLDAFEETPPHLYRYATYKPKDSVLAGLARSQIDTALFARRASAYAMENANRTLLAARKLIEAGVSRYSSAYQRDHADVVVPSGTRLVVAAQESSGGGIAVYGSSDARRFRQLGVYRARSANLYGAQLRAAPNQEPKLYAYDQRTIYRWRLQSTTPEIDWPIPIDDIDFGFDALDVFQSPRFELMASESRTGRRWLKIAGRPELVELVFRREGKHSRFRDHPPGLIGATATGFDKLLVEELDERSTTPVRVVDIRQALAMRPELFATRGRVNQLMPPTHVDIAPYQGFTCVLAECYLDSGDDALLFLDATTGGWLRTPIVHGGFRGETRLTTVAERSYVVRAIADGAAAALAWNVSNANDATVPPVIAKWTTKNLGARVVAASGYVLCSSTDDTSTAFAILDLHERKPRFRKVRLEGASSELYSAIHLPALTSQRRA